MYKSDRLVAAGAMRAISTSMNTPTDILCELLSTIGDAHVQLVKAEHSRAGHLSQEQEVLMESALKELPQKEFGK